MEKSSPKEARQNERGAHDAERGVKALGQSSRNEESEDEESESDAEPEAEPRVPCVCGRLNKPSCSDCRRCRPPAVEGGFRVFRLKSCFACRTVPAKNLCGVCGARSYCSAECVLAD